MVGEYLWVERFPRFGESVVTWVVVDPRVRRAVATLELPAGSRPMSGRGESVLLVERDEFDVETVVVRPVVTR